MILDAIRKAYTFPFDLYPYQEDTVEELGGLPRAGLYLDPGCGKTAVSTASALYKKLMRRSQTIVAMPPILLDGWAKWLAKIKPNLSVTVYRGSPKKRQQLALDTDFILVSLQIFKQDYDRFDEYFRNKPVTLILDEAHSIKNISSGNHKLVHGFVINHDCELMLLTGTPLTTPEDAYAYVKLIAPGTYRNFGQFERIHVAERDFFDKVKEWQNLDVLASNMGLNSKRVVKEEVLDQLPQVTYSTMTYDLDAKHLRLYNRLVEEQLLPLKDGGKIDATTAPALWNNLQQIILNYAYFAQDPGVKPAGLDLLDEVIDEIGDRKLLVFANYRMTNRMLVEYLRPYGAVAIYGEVSDKQKVLNKDRFIEDPKCRILVAQPTSAGYGVDGLQDVCSEALFIESPITPNHFTQALARLYRNGQKFNVHCRLAVANQTLQVRLHKGLLNKDDLISGVQGNYASLRSMLYGD